MNPGVADTIDELRSRGVRVALASSSPMDSILAVLEACDLSDKFELIVSGKDFHESKPNPAIYLYTIEKLDLDASECCCIEDSVPGIAAGKAAGLTVFAKREDRFGFSQDRADASSTKFRISWVSLSPIACILKALIFISAALALVVE